MRSCTSPTAWNRGAPSPSAKRSNPSPSAISTPRCWRCWNRRSFISRRGNSKPHPKPSPHSPRTPVEGDHALPDLIDLVRDAALDLKAEDVTTLPLDGRTIVADAFLVATGRSKIQTRSIADAIVERARGAGYPVARTEGYLDGGWILIDLGTVVAHIFTPEQRAFYNLERLWGAPDV